MTSLNYLKNIILSLSKEESSFFLQYLNKKYNQKLKDESKSIVLFKTIRSTTDCSPSELQKIIYGRLNYHAFNKLLIRLREKILDILLLKINYKDEVYSSRNREVFELRKKIIQLDILTLKGVRGNLENQYNLIIERAKKIELYDVQLQALYAKQRHSGFKISSNKINMLRNEINKIENTWIAYNRSQSKFNEMMTKISAASSFENYNTELNETLASLKESYSQTASATIGYYYYFLLTDKEQNLLNFKNAEECLNKMLTLLSKNKSIYTQNRYGTVLLNIANNKIFLRDYDSSLKFALESKVFFPNQLLNISLAEEVEFYNHLYKKQFEEAFKIILKLASYPLRINSELLQSKRTYLLGCMKFMQGQFAEALDTFKEFREIEKDKEGWNMAKRIVSILCRIELGELESTDLNMQSLDKFLKRILKIKLVQPRYIIIFRILKKLISENFEYEKVYKVRRKYFELLESSIPDYSWKMKGPELIIFEQWFKSKIKSKRDPFERQSVHLYIKDDLNDSDAKQALNKILS